MVRRHFFRELVWSEMSCGHKYRRPLNISKRRKIAPTASSSNAVDDDATVNNVDVCDVTDSESESSNLSLVSPLANAGKPSSSRVALSFCKVTSTVGVNEEEP